MAQGKRGGKKAGGRQNAHKGLPVDMEDDVDIFHKQRDRVALAPENDEMDSDDSEGEEAVMGLGDDSDNSAGASDLEDVDDITSDDDEMIQNMKAQAKALKQRIRLARGAEPGDSDEEEGADAAAKQELRDRLWGASKRNYYGADEEEESDEDAMEEEEKEARRLQREQAAGVRAEDLGIESDSGDSSEGDDADAPLVNRVSRGPTAARPGDAGALADGNRVAAIERDAPELEALVGELKGALKEVRQRVAPLVSIVKEGKLATEQGVSYLEAKHMLLLSYCSQLVFYLLAKAEGLSVKEHPVVQRLVETRMYLEKIRPIDKKLRYQIDKLLQAAHAAGDLSGQDAGDLALRANPGEMVLEGGEAEEEDGGVYRPPKLREVAMKEDMEESRLKKEMRAAKERRRRAERSELVRELEEEITGAPKEMRIPGGASESAFALREQERMDERERAEEDMMMRVPLTKNERRRARAARALGGSGAALVDDIGGEVAGLLDADELTTGLEDDGTGLLRKRLAQKYAAPVPQKKAMRSGDEDLPLREPLGDRRAKHDRKRALAAAHDDSDGEPQRVREEDEFYRSAKESSKRRRQEREEALHVPEHPPLLEPETRGPRAVTSEILKNRGLTPRRNKEIKNPRKKHRLKYEKAMVRHRGQVPAMREREAGYGGEATGIKANVSKSRRIKS